MLYKMYYYYQSVHDVRVCMVCGWGGVCVVIINFSVLLITSMP